MSDEISQLTEILDKAIAFEEEGISFFSERAETTASPMERNILRSLAHDERDHKAYLLELKEELRRNSRLDGLPGDSHSYRGPRQVFEEAMAKADDPHDPAAEEITTLDGALEVERRGYAMYTGAAARVGNERARALLLHLARQEQNHYELLRNTRDYMTDPAGWHGYDESPMLDGG